MRALARALLLLLALVGGEAAALADGPPLLMETHVGLRPKDADSYLKYLVRAMGSAPLRHGDKLAAAVRDKVSGSAGPIKIGGSMRSRVEDGRRQFIMGNYAKAITSLEAARRDLMAHIGTVASNQSYRNSLHQALLFLAHAYLRNKQPEPAADRIGEAIRSFADRDLSLSRHSPDLMTFYKKVRRELGQQKRGTLAVRTKPAGLAVFVNEQYRFVSPSTLADLHPGKYRVYVQQGARRGRVHEVSVNPGGEASVSIDFEFDNALKTRPYVGLRYRDVAEQKKHMVSHAAIVGRALDAPTVILVGFRQHEGRRTLTGTVVSTSTSRTVRSGMIALEPATPSPESFKALARVRLAGQNAPGVIVTSGLGPIKSGADDEHDGPGFFSARVFKWITLGLGVAVGAAGGVLIGLDGVKTCDAPEGVACPEQYNTLAPGIALAVSGGALLATSVVLFIIDAKASKARRARAPTLTPWIAASGGGLVGRWSF